MLPLRAILCLCPFSLLLMIYTAKLAQHPRPGLIKTTVVVAETTGIGCNRIQLEGIVGESLGHPQSSCLSAGMRLALKEQ